MLLAIRLWLGKKLFGDVGSASPTGIRVSPRRWIKWCRPPEVEALQFVAANTTIPVPKAYQTYSYKGHLLVELEYVKGVPLMMAWWKLDEDQKRSLMKELGGYIRQLRDLKPPDDFRISSTLGRPCRDTRVGQAPFGPFDNTEPFHACLRGQIPLDDPSFDESVTRCHNRQYKVRYTHGDLSILNILVHRGKISAIIDWECAGWYPEYWEWTRAHYNVYNMPDLYELLWEQFDDHFDEELKAERHLWRVFDQPMDNMNNH